MLCPLLLRSLHNASVIRVRSVAAEFYEAELAQDRTEIFSADDRSIIVESHVIVCASDELDSVTDSIRDYDYTISRRLIEGSIFRAKH
jgi:hypothetical protein